MNELSLHNRHDSRMMYFGISSILEEHFYDNEKSLPATLISLSAWEIFGKIEIIYQNIKPYFTKWYQTESKENTSLIA